MDDFSEMRERLLAQADTLSERADDSIARTGELLADRKAEFLARSPEGMVGQVDQEQAFVRELFERLGVDTYDYFSCRGFLLGCSLGVQAVEQRDLAMILPHMMAYSALLAYELLEDDEDDERMPEWPDEV